MPLDHNAEKAIAPVRLIVDEATTVGPRSIHGRSHWDRVESNGLLIAAESGADPIVVALFALFHDCMRESDGWDPEHGPRAAEFIRRRSEALHFLSRLQLDQLLHACSHHTHEIHHPDVTIGTCYDADRLELPRVGIVPDPRKLNTAFAKALTRR